MAPLDQDLASGTNENRYGVDITSTRPGLRFI